MPGLYDMSPEELTQIVQWLRCPLFASRVSCHLFCRLGEPIEISWTSSDECLCDLEWFPLRNSPRRTERYLWRNHWVAVDEIWTAALLANQVQSECNLIASSTEVEVSRLRVMLLHGATLPIADKIVQAVLHTRIGISLHQIGRDDMFGTAMFDAACHMLRLNSFLTEFSREWDCCPEQWQVTSKQTVQFMRTLPPCIGIFRTPVLPVMSTDDDMRLLPGSFQCLDVGELGGFVSCKRLERVVLPAQLGVLGRRAFFGCKKLLTVTMPNSLFNIRDGAFTDCHRMEINRLPACLDDVGPYAFLNCRSLNVRELPADIRIVRDYAFSHCASIRIDCLPPRLNHVGRGAFEHCSSMRLQEIKGDIRVLDERVFTGCTQLRLCRLPASMTEIRESAFEGCIELVLRELPKSTFRWMLARSDFDCRNKGHRAQSVQRMLQTTADMSSGTVGID